MRRRIVCDASAVVAMLLDSGRDGQWAAEMMSGADLFAPCLLPFECANILRRYERSGAISGDQAAQSHADLLDLPVELWPYESLSTRAWALRDNLSSYDAAYVALAEEIGAAVLTLDRRICGAPGLECIVAVPEQD